MLKDYFILKLLIILVLLCQNCIADRSCESLLYGQYYCDDPEIDVNTQQPKTCNPDRSIQLNCKTRPGLTCNNGNSVFVKKIENACTYSTDKSHSTTLILSVFFGIFGADRLYLGHYTMGLFKLFSCGFFLILYMADIVFIALEIIGSANEASYFVNRHGPRVLPHTFNNESTLFLFNCFDCV